MVRDGSPTHGGGKTVVVVLAATELEVTLDEEVDVCGALVVVVVAIVVEVGAIVVDVGGIVGGIVVDVCGALVVVVVAIVVEVGAIVVDVGGSVVEVGGSVVEVEGSVVVVEGGGRFSRTHAGSQLPIAGGSHCSPRPASMTPSPHRGRTQAVRHASGAESELVIPSSHSSSGTWRPSPQTVTLHVAAGPVRQQLLHRFEAFLHSRLLRLNVCFSAFVH
jgi:hypothetical protein